jgi:hypothetical protein
MRKLVLLSILFAMVALPMRAAGHPSPILGLRRALLQTALFCCLYWFAIVFVVPRL